MNDYLGTAVVTASSSRSRIESGTSIPPTTSPLVSGADEFVFIVDKAKSEMEILATA